MTDIKPQIQTAIDELKDVSSLSPQDASQKLVQLSVLYSSLSTELANAAYWYNLKLKQVMDDQEKKNVAAAKIEAQASREFDNLLKLQALEKSMVEIIRSLKLLIRVSEKDYQFSKLQ